MTVEPVFLDTSGLVALLSADDWLHEPAVREFEACAQSGRHVITTDWVLAELGNGLARTAARVNVPACIEALMREPCAQVIFVDAELLARGVARYIEYADKTWGLVDCVSFEVMQQAGCRAALTHDRHFEQAGFQRLLADRG